MENKYCEYPVAKTFDITALMTVRFFSMESDDVEITEAQSFWEFLYVDAGEVTVGCENDEYTLKQGEVCFQPPGVRHSLHCADDAGARLFLIAFVCDGNDMTDFQSKRGMLPAELAHYIPSLMQDAFQTFELSVHHFGSDSLQKRSDAIFGGEQALINRFELFLIELARKEERNSVVPLIRQMQIRDELVLKIISILEENIYQKLSMNAIVENMNYSETYIARRFKAVCGQGIMSYYLQLRIREAQKLIRETEKNFTEIAGMLGFSDSQHFTKTFKKYVHMTPKEYLKSVRPYYMRQNKNIVKEENE